MDATLQGDFGTATITLPDSAKDNPEQTKNYLDSIESHIGDIKSGKMPLPDYESFIHLHSVTPNAGGMGDLKMAESPAGQFQKDNIFPSVANLPPNAGSVSKIFHGVTDLLNLPTRAAAAAFTDQKMSDPNAYALRPLVENSQSTPDTPTDQGNVYTKSLLPYTTDTKNKIKSSELIGQLLSDPLLLSGLFSHAVSKGGVAGADALSTSLKWMQEHASKISELSPELLQKAGTPEGLSQLKNIAGSADQAGPFEQNMINSFKSEPNINPTFDIPSSVKEIKPGASGEAIQTAIEDAKQPMQEAWKAGDQASVGPLRDAPADAYTRTRIIPGVENKQIGPYGEKKTIQVPTETPITEEVKVLPGKLSQVLDEFKATDPNEGVRKISAGATGAIKSLIGMSNQGGHTIDDLLNVKAELRRVRSGPGFDGNPFDNTVDDVAFSKANDAIDGTIFDSIKKAAPDKADEIKSLLEANSGQYTKAKVLLSDLSNRFGKVQNSTNVISKVKAMGPSGARDLIDEASNNPALQGVVPRLREGFINDLLLSSIRKGEVSSEEFAKKWADPSMQEIKTAWLDPGTISKVDGAIAEDATRLKTIGETKALGMGKEGVLSSVPMSRTGRSTLGGALGDAIGGLIGGSTGLIFSHSAGTAGAAFAGSAYLTHLGRAVGSFIQSPAGAVATYNKMAEMLPMAKNVSEKSGKIADGILKATNRAAQIKLAAVLMKEIQNKDSGAKE